MMKRRLILLLVMFFFVLSGCTSSNIDKGDENHGIIQNGQNHQQNQKEETTTEENKTNQKQECTDENGIYTCACIHVGDEGKQTQEEQILISVSVYGLNKEIIASETINICEGSSAYDALLCVLDKNNITYKTSGFAKFVYISEISGLKEKEHGTNSGWKYNINDEYINKGCARYILLENDKMEWYYEHD